MTLASVISDLATRLGVEFKAIRAEAVTALSGKANTSHNHAAADTNSGAFALARIPTGTSSSTVSLGDHNHSGTYDGAGAASTAVSTHEGLTDPHPGYLTPAEGNAAYDASGAATTAVSAHAAAGDPHPGYLTPAEGNAAYDAIGAATASTAAHVAAGDPHPGYLTPSEGNAAYQPIDPTLTAFGALTIAANKLPYGSGSDAFSLADLTAAGRALLDDADAAAQLTTLGVSAFVQTLLDDAAATNFLTTLGVSTYVKTLLDDTDASTALSTLGLSTFVKTLMDDADASTFLSTLGITTFIKTLLDDADAATALATLGAVSAASPTFTGTVTAPRIIKPPQALSSGTANLTIDASTGDNQKVTATGNPTLLAPTNGVDGQVLVIEVLASGGARTVFLNAAILLTSGQAASYVVSSGKIATIILKYSALAGSVWFCTSMTQIL